MSRGRGGGATWGLGGTGNAMVRARLFLPLPPLTGHRRHSTKGRPRLRLLPAPGVREPCRCLHLLDSLHARAAVAYTFLIVCRPSSSHVASSLWLAHARGTTRIGAPSPPGCAIATRVSHDRGAPRSHNDAATATNIAIKIASKIAIKTLIEAATKIVSLLAFPVTAGLQPAKC